MDMKPIIKEGFKVFVNKTFKNDGIKKFLLNHERLELFQTNLLKQIKESFHVIKQRDTIDKLIMGMSGMFCKAALEHKEMELNKDFKPTIIKTEECDDFCVCQKCISKMTV